MATSPDFGTPTTGPTGMLRKVVGLHKLLQLSPIKDGTVFTSQFPGGFQSDRTNSTFRGSPTRDRRADENL